MGYLHKVAWVSSAKWQLTSPNVSDLRKRREEVIKFIMVNVTIFSVLSSNSTQEVIYIGLISDSEASEVYLGSWLT